MFRPYGCCRLLVNRFMNGMMHCMFTVHTYLHMLLAAFIATLMLFELFALKAFTPLENRRVISCCGIMQ